MYFLRNIRVWNPFLTFQNNTYNNISVIKCGDIPTINNVANHEETVPPYVPATTVKYKCKDNYHFKDKSSIECVRNGADAVWTNNSIKCIPGICIADSHPLSPNPWDFTFFDSEIWHTTIRFMDTISLMKSNK